MIDIKYLREYTDEIRCNLEARNAKVNLDELLEADKKYLVLLQEVESLRGERNQTAEAMKGSVDDRTALVEKGRQIKAALSAKEEELQVLENQRKELLFKIPNLTHPDAPVGKSDEDNKEVRQVGKPAKLENPVGHVELVEKHSLADFERGTKVSGSKFYFLKNQLAILDQAVLRYAVDFMVKEGFEFIITPDLAKEDVLIGKGFLPRGPETQVYYVENQDLALIGTSEITVLGYHMNETLNENLLPKKYVALSHCYRTEAGSYGRESYGFYRVHQFSKVEMMAFCKPDQSEALHQEFLSHEERFWKSLGIPYRVVDCCTGDLGGSDYRRYDIEAWMWGKGEGKGGYGEVTSTSNCIDYQARGLNIKYETKEGERGYAHTLNGTVVATPRALIAILENYQQDDGTIKIPDVLMPYCGFSSIG
ncbi:MAG: serine--tRNA ligase [Patescibacteria group bacterium]|nr:serine--tRNA ligase [Patescibacteria group bacterium]